MAEQQTNGDFSDITLGDGKAITQISNADPAVVTFVAGHGYTEGDFIYLADFDNSLFPTIMTDLPASHDFVVAGPQNSWTMNGAPATCETDASGELTVVVDSLGQGITSKLNIVENKIYKLSVDYTASGQASTTTEYTAFYSGGNNIEFLFGTSDQVFTNRNGGTCYAFFGNGTKVVYFKALSTVSGENIIIESDVIIDGFTFTLDNPTIEEVANLNGHIYQLGTFTGDTAPISNYAGDLDLSALAAVTSTGNAQLATLTDWTVGDGIGPFNDVSVRNSFPLPVSHDFLVGGASGGWSVWRTLDVCETDADGKLSVTNNAANGGYNGVFNRMYVPLVGSTWRISFDFTISNNNDGEQVVFTDWDGYYNIISSTGAGVTNNAYDVNLTESTRVTVDVEVLYSATTTDFAFYADGYVDNFSYTIDNFICERVYSTAAQVTGSQSAETSLLQDLTEANKLQFDVAWTQSERSAGGVAPTSGGTDGTEQTVDGTYNETLKCVGTADTGLKPSVLFTGLIDNVVMTDVPRFLQLTNQFLLDAWE